LLLDARTAIFSAMSTLAEIEAAAATLSAAEMKQLEDFLRERRVQAEEAHLQELYRITGFHPLPKRNNEVITNQMINQLREEENI
jgi:hypothetical protein